MEETFSYLIAGFVGALVSRIIYKIDKHFTKKEAPKSMSLCIYAKDYETRKTTLIFHQPLYNSVDYVEPPEWVCKKDTTYKFIIG